MTHSHRPSTGLHQSNKPFKGSSNRKIKTAGKQELVIKALKSAVKMSKQDRRNRSKNIQKVKKEEQMMMKRIFQGRNGVPKILTVIPLCPDVCASKFKESLIENNLIEHISENYYECSKYNQKFQILEASRDVQDLISKIQGADYLIFLLSGVEEVDEQGELFLKICKSHGVPLTVSIAQNMQNVEEKRKGDVKKSLQSYMNYHFPSEERIYLCDSLADCELTVRHVANQIPKQMKWREFRPYMVVDSIETRVNEEDNSKCLLKVTGYSRGNVGFSANRLVHLPGLGDFQVSNVLSCPLNGMEEKIIDTFDSNRESLQAENIPDVEMMDERFDITDEEVLAGEERIKQILKEREEEEEGMAVDNKMFKKPTGQMKKVPKGTSSYQAAWIVESDDEDEEENVENEMKEDSEISESEFEEEEIITIDDSEIKNDLLSPEEEEKEFKEFMQKKNELKNEMDFPDEVDTPLNKSAKERFMKYRGLESFRTSFWDPYENLPEDYSRIFQFDNFKKTSEKAKEAAFETKVACNERISLIIENVPLVSNFPLTVFGLLRHEQKISLNHFTILRTEEFQDPIKSKDELILFTGVRRLKINPLFSQNNKGKLHKFERYLKHGDFYVGSYFGPILFGPAPILLFKQSEEGSLTLVGTGSLQDPEPTRMIIKRIILTGFPYKIHKRSASVRYMFFNPSDVAWFKPVQLVTKYGRRGHIKESLGTHGYMKCTFDKQIQQQDTICMYLYKRVFPKWNTTLFNHQQ
ncbi:Ribosome biogenesis protein BMS1/TSR1 domain-containing protein [Rozella allomycis CSF55]|uniref:Ribosome biogenesis protein BMS1/TSR1 domain-containing protein n=1 Tax=Rozella allomycis (strain CSF55) TaxID=988480 RepID=A0A075AYD8_ROZAC|nr:Ribosome biogenesis protein BMS1/TSR1 domain-containing protein [Rozella allomycis CSF55]|eukprot:EPZ35109.1 Ribosome biogenesis protein BMS1/TSR1 domain-containing protein [Rozella allomycis CSF55]